MKKLMLAVFVAALPLTSFAQKDSDQREREGRSAGEKAREAAEAGVSDAAKLRDSIDAAIAELEAAAKAFIDTVVAGLGKDAGERAKEAGKVAAAQAKLEIAGVKLETLYDKAVRLRVRAAQELGAAAEAEASDDPAKAVPVPDSLMGMAAAAARLRLANAQLEGGAAARSIVGRKIRRARQGKDSTLPAAVAERLRAAVVEITSAKNALRKAAEEAGEIGASGGGKAVGHAAGPAAAQRGAAGGGKAVGKALKKR